MKIFASVVTGSKLNPRINFDLKSYDELEWNDAISKSSSVFLLCFKILSV